MVVDSADEFELGEGDKQVFASDAFYFNFAKI